MSFKNEEIVETKTCQKCRVSFDITDKDLEFYGKISPKFAWKKYAIPSPELCPGCREKKRMVAMNQHKLYKSDCYKCRQQVVSRFHEQSSIVHYCYECWAWDDWDKMEHGMDIDFSKSIFEQIWNLVSKTPFQSLIGALSNVKNNSHYTNHASELQSCYLVSQANKIQDACYSEHMNNSHDAIDNSFVGNSEYVYECIDCYDMYKAYFCQQSTSCRNSYFLSNCTNCENCIGCHNLNGKSYYIFNAPVTQQEYEVVCNSLRNYSAREEFREKYLQFLKEQIFQSNNIVWSEDCSGDNIISSSNCSESFDMLGSQDCKYCTSVNTSSDIYDVSSYGEKSSLMYESISVWRYSNNILFSASIGKGEHLIYCIDVKKSQHCFACVNLKEAEYCILNKQYTRQEYEVLVPEIIASMQDAWEWGDFFPEHISPFWYNESVATEYFPLTQQQALDNWYNWSDYETPAPNVEKIISVDQLPESIENIPDDILNWAIKCEVTKKPFRIIAQELAFYRKHNLPIPRRHPDQRRSDRMALRNPRRLYHRDCDKCWVSMNTTYDPDWSEQVYCENCYNREVY